MDKNDRYLTLQEAAQFLRTTPNRLYKSLSLKEIPSNIYGKFGRKILFIKPAVIDWVENTGGGLAI